MSAEPWTLDDVEALREGRDFEAKRTAGKDGGGKLPDDSWPAYSARGLLRLSGGSLSQSLPQRLSQTANSPQNLTQGLPQTSTVAGEHWSPREQVETAILELCKGRFLTVREIATALARSLKTIRQNYVTRLVADGRLELRDRDNPTIPDQAYRTVERHQ